MGRRAWAARLGAATVTVAVGALSLQALESGDAPADGSSSSVVQAGDFWSPAEKEHADAQANPWTERHDGTVGRSPND
ncbi:hypothetical protein SAMN06264364_1586 [Quadrisphaera granulorum]|uniref:Uncharacterized protein n=2 Tax=Quadrisphaera granulorum TaxID=317664 RepID=A0A315ZKE2_9ACTN|nr:hypothetical protein BXY45_1586 [Quadrisphaera granulorum]SZE99188.1 hypothetical protein SAMN06264364_1586 [Quadrisphaera granulorum]